MNKIKIENNLFGGFWLASWLFTIGFLKLGLGKTLLAILLWPYYIGEAVSNFIR